MRIGELSFDFPPSVRVTWNIPDFFRLAADSGFSLQSPDFAFADSRYCLRLLESREIGVDCIGIRLQNFIDTDPRRAVLCEVRFKSGNEEININSHMRDNNEEFVLYRSRLDGKRDLYVPNGTMTVHCFVRPRKLSSAGTPKSGGTQTRVIPKSRMSSGELSFEPFPFLYVTWTIPGFFQLPQGSRHLNLESLKFPFSDRLYYLRLVWYGICVDIQLVNSTDPFPGRYVSYEVGLKSTTGEEIHIRRSDTSATGDLYIYRSDLDSKKCECFLDGHLTVFCCMGSSEPRGPGSPKSGGAETPGSKAPVPQAATHTNSVGVHNSNEDGNKEGLPGISKLQSDLRKLLQKESDRDACLVVCGKEFRAHQNILRARSTVFDAMFGHETAERESGRVVIDDLDPDSFGHFLEYLYTGGVGAGLSDDNVFGLYKAADKYDVSTLMAECVAHMRRSLSVGSFCDVLAVALQHPEKELLSRVVFFFKENMARIIVTPKWQQFATDNGAGVNVLLMKAVVPAGQ